MSEIEQLTARVAELSPKADFWNNGVLMFLVMTALAAAGIVICQRLAFVRAGQKASAQSELDATKEHEAKTERDRVRTELATAETKAKEADARIAEAQRGSAEANERAVAIEHANLRLRKDLEAAVNESRANQTELEHEQRRTAEAQLAAAQAQLELKKYVNALVSSQSRAINEDLFTSILRKAPPKTVEILYLRGLPETYLFAQAILSLLRIAGWHTESDVPLPVDSLVDIGKQGTGLREIVVEMNRTEVTRDESTTEGALWKAILSLKRGCGQVQNKIHE